MLCHNVVVLEIGCSADSASLNPVYQPQHAVVPRSSLLLAILGILKPEFWDINVLMVIYQKSLRQVPGVVAEASILGSSNIITKHNESIKVSRERHKEKMTSSWIRHGQDPIAKSHSSAWYVAPTREKINHG